MSILESLDSLGLTPLQVLGEGAFGKVFHCADSQGADLAVKVCTEPQARLSAQSEAAVMGALPAHRNVVGIVSFKALPSMTLMAMPLATGGDTLKMMQERACAPLAESEVRGLFGQLLDAVEHMHSHGLVHRDIKCENILLSGMQRRTVLLADFGFAARYTKGAKALSDPFGSLHYSSPEICNESAYEGPEVDVWSMGVVLYAWAFGRLPFGGATNDEIAARIVTGNFAIPRQASPELAALLTHILTVDPAKRATIADIRKSAWLAPAAAAAAPQWRPVPVSTSAVNLATRLVDAPEQRRRNSDAEVRRPSRLARAFRAILGK